MNFAATAALNSHSPRVSTPAPAARVAANMSQVETPEDHEAREALRRAEAFTRAEMRREQVRGALLTVLPPLFGIALFIGIWAIISMTSPQL